MSKKDSPNGAAPRVTAKLGKGIAVALLLELMLLGVIILGWQLFK